MALVSSVWLIGMGCGSAGVGPAGDTGLATGDSASADANHPPTAPGVVISPDQPDEHDDLLCELSPQATDPDGDPVQHAYTWTRDDTAVAHTDPLLPASETASDQVWACEVSASDGLQTGPAGRAKVTIAPANRPPSAPTVAIEPAEPASNQGFSCVVTTDASDPDGDTLSYGWAWTRDGTVADVDGPDVDPADTVAGETWTCTVTASDGEFEVVSDPAQAVLGPNVYGPDVTHVAVDVFCSSCYACPEETWYVPELAFDDDVASSTWHTTWTGGPEWVGVDFGEGGERRITRYGLMGASFHEGYRAVSWQLQGSSDQASWTELHAVTGADLAYVMYGGEPFTYYEFTNQASYRYYRLHVTENAGGQPYADELGIVEIEMMEDGG